MAPRMTRRSVMLTLASLPLLAAGCAGAGGSSDADLTDAARSRCFDMLVAALADRSPWVRVHAAEALVALKRPEPALAAFRPLAETSEPRYRIVVWRVLAAAEPEAGRRRRYVDRIRRAFLDAGGPDRPHASEALAKLNEPMADDAERRLVRGEADGAGPASPFAIWRLAQAGDATAVERLVSLLGVDDAVTRTRAAYVLGRLQSPPSRVVADALAAALAKEPAESPARPMLRAALGGEAARALARDAQGPAAGRYFAAMHLAESGTPRDHELLARLLNDADSDVRVGAAYAMLRIDARAAPAGTRSRALGGSSAITTPGPRTAFARPDRGSEKPA
jgi:SSS family solute:Na+ symporter